MLYADRNENGNIIGISINPTVSDNDPISDEELTAFIAESATSSSLLDLINILDIDLIRVLEDLVDLLIKKNIILFSELPPDAQKKLAKRKAVRNQIQQQEPPIIQDEEDLF